MKESIDDFVIHCLKRATLKGRPHTVEQHRPDESVRGMVVAVGMPVEWFVGIGNVALVGADFLYLNFAEAIEAARIMFQSGETDALVALGHGVWLAVTFPVDPELSVALLQDIIEETPDDSDGAAVAAAVAAYVVELRSEGKEHESLSFFTNQMLGAVARRHSGIEDQEAFDRWIERLELHDPARFLPRLRNVVDVLVQDNWWIDREAIQASLPVQ